jgi:hypothetical protein
MGDRLSSPDTKAAVETATQRRETTMPATITTETAEVSQILEDEFGVPLKGSDVAKIKTVGDAVDLVVTRAG